MDKVENKIILNNDVITDLVQDSEKIIEACILLPQMTKKISDFEKRKALLDKLGKALHLECKNLPKESVLSVRNEIEMAELNNTIKILENTIHNNSQRKTKVEEVVDNVAPLANEYCENTLRECLIMANNKSDYPRVSMFEPLLNSEQWKEMDSHELVATFVDAIRYKAYNSKC